MSFAVREFLIDNRVPICAGLLVFVLASMFVLTSQSGSSFATYLLGIYVIYGIRGWAPLLMDRLFWAIVALLAYLVVTIFWSASWNLREVLSEVVRALLVLTFVVAVAECFQVDWFESWMTRTLGLFGGVAALVAIMVFMAESSETATRLAGLGQLDTHIEAALVFGVASICAIASITRGDRYLWFHVAALVALGVAIMLSDSRTGISAACLGAYTYLMSRRISDMRRFVVWTLVGILAAMVALTLAYWWIPGISDILFPRGDSFRLSTWRELLPRVWSDGPWLGLGLLTPGTVMVDGYMVVHPHNIYISVFHQGGLVGFGLLMVVVLSALRSLLVHYDRPEAKLGLAMFAVGLSGLLLDGVTVVEKIGWMWFIFWLPVAIALGLTNRIHLTDAARFSGRFEA